MFLIEQGCGDAVSRQVPVICLAEVPFLSTSSALWVVKAFAWQHPDLSWSLPHSKSWKSLAFESKTGPSLPTHKAGVAGGHKFPERRGHLLVSPLSFGRQGRGQPGAGQWRVASSSGPGPQKEMSLSLSWRAGNGNKPTPESNMSVLPLTTTNVISNSYIISLSQFFSSSKWGW